MPSKSKAERRAMAIAEHHPDQLYARNRGLLDMTHQQLHDFASTKEQGLPERVKGGQSHRTSHPGRNLGKHLRDKGPSGKPWSAHQHPKKSR